MALSPSRTGIAPLVLPPSCERALLERFLRAEAMALWAVRAAQTQQLPRHVQTFLQRHETDEQEHLRQFEGMLGTMSQRPATLPTVPSQWEMLAVLLFGYEALGLEFATLLAGIRPDLSDILEDEQVHVGFFEKELRAILAGGETGAQQAREAARTWWKKLPRTVDRYLQDPSLEPYRSGLRTHILGVIGRRFVNLGLLADGTLSHSQ
ncbi:MAG: ferritin-like domain-containing protein [Nitrospira sp.]|nr:ferritin-like domain-containing protein [Nitrospira sp.]MBX3371074.1 ferritin-like domain-containing protein [Nitrospira sp.]